MNRITRSPLAQFSSFALLVCFCAGVILTGSAHTQEDRRAAQLETIQGDSQSTDLSNEYWTQGDKISPDLQTQIDNASASRDFSTLASKEKAVRAVVQLKRQPGRALSRLLSSAAVVEKGRYLNFNARLIEMPLSMINQLASFKEVYYVSLDRDVEMHGHVENTAGAATMRQQSGNSGLDGSGIGIAVLDSGIFRAHKSLTKDDSHSRIVAGVDFTGQGITTNDPYGHGTHVAGLAASSGKDGISTAYRGIAPNANVINLRVLDAQGRGTTSAVLSALDWVLTNRAAYNIRVVNMSLGALSIDSYVTDPLCRAVRRLVDAGIVCVAAAGNNGKDSNGNKVYGLIHSPG
ncbi:MAG TPA: S8 family serine peptidase, partial [Blastocatellia bacterium]|nr:S8 family serine peptidase [Blastocatellia bacterium]